MLNGTITLRMKRANQSVTPFYRGIIAWGVFLLTTGLSGCVSDEKEMATEEIATVPHLLVDDFAKRIGVNRNCTFDSSFWPEADTEALDSETDSSENGSSCSTESRPNLFKGCPRIFSYQSGSAKYGKICTSYDDSGLTGPHPALKIDFDIGNIGGDYNDSFACLVEPLGVSEEGPPFDIEELGLQNVTFWVFALQENTNMEISITDASKLETQPKRLLSQYIKPTLPPNKWKKVTIPISHLIRRDAGIAVDSSNLLSVVFCFASNRFSELPQAFAARGTIYLDDIAFEP